MQEGRKRVAFLIILLPSIKTLTFNSFYHLANGNGMRSFPCTVWRAVCWSPVQVKCLPRSDLSRLDLVEWRSAHGQVVKPLIRLGIQPVIRLSVKRDGNLSQFSVNNTSNQFLQLTQNSSGTV